MQRPVVPMGPRREAGGREALLRETIEQLRRRNAEFALLNAALATEAGERRRIEESLRESEAKFRALAQSAPDAIVSADVRGRVVFWNDSARAMFGYGTPEILGRPITDLMPAAQRPAYLRRLEDFLRDTPADVPPKALALRAVAKDGREFPVEVSFAVWSVEGRKFFSAIIRDVTERRELEKTLMRVDKMVSLGRMSAGLFHDFSAPLTVIYGYASLLRERAPKDDPAAGPIDMILKQSMRCTQMVRSIMDFSRAESAVPGRFNVNDSVRAAVALVRALVHSRDGAAVSVKEDLAASSPEMLGDPGQIEQIVVNLANNAVDAMPEGGALAVSTRRVADAGKDAVEIEVADTGMGMSEETQKRMFEPFFTTKGNKKGTGLGLWIVHELVAKHAGKIDCRSAPGKGATFVVRLPLAPAAPPETAEEAGHVP